MTEYRCTICDETFEDDWDGVKSHVYHKHDGDRCGFCQSKPEMFVTVE